MSAKRKRVQVLYASGIEFVEPYSLARASTILTNYLDLQSVADADLIVLNHQPGIDVAWDIAARIGETIFKTYDQYDGFVVLHSSDQAMYVANLLTFLFERLGKPIIFAGHTTHQSDEVEPKEIVHEMNVRTNLITAMQLAIMDYSGVILAYGSEIMPAVRALDQRLYSADYFSSVVTTDLPKRHSLSAKFQPHFSAAVAFIQLLPQLEHTITLPLGTKAVVIIGGADQALPTGVVLPLDIPIVVCSPAEAVDVMADNIILAKGILWPAALAKTMVCVATTKTIADFKKCFKRNVAGEYIPL